MRKTVKPKGIKGEAPARVGDIPHALTPLAAAMYNNFSFTDEDFAAVRRMIHDRVGISLAESKKMMAYGRLSKRLRTLRIKSFREYLNLLDDPFAREWEHFINSLTTNITQFFREEHHFPILAAHMKRMHALRNRPVVIWSAGCSSGEEPYTIAMAACEAFGTMTPPVQILATDIGTHVLTIAKAGEYVAENLEGVSTERLKAFFLKGKGDKAGMVKVMPELQKLITFQRHNLRDQKWALPYQFDAIFCRNVMIYFKADQQMRVMANFASLMGPEAIFFAGHSESLKHLNVPFRSAGKSVYQWEEGVKSPVQTTDKSR